MHDLTLLSAPFPASAIRWNVGAMNREKTEGVAVPNIDPRAIENRLDETVGVAGWEVEFSETVGGDHLVAVRCAISLHVEGRKVTKEDGAQADLVRGADESGKGHELSVKGAYTNAFKRAASKWGVGRYLYAYQAPWVKLDLQGRIKEIPALPPHMRPVGEAAVVAVAVVPPRSDRPVVSTAPSEAPAGPSAPRSAVETPATPVQTEAVVLRKFATDLLDRVSKVDADTFRQYLNSPKCRSKLTDAEYQHILAKLPQSAHAA